MGGLLAILLIGLGWLCIRWRPMPRISETTNAPAEPTPSLVERRAAYTAFRRSVHALLEAVDEGVYAMGLLYEVRDQWMELRRVAPPAVAGPANQVIDALKPVIDRGPTNESFAQLTRALHGFDEACQADRTQSVPAAAPVPREPVPAAPTRRYFSVDPPVSEVLDQSDEEAALSREFVGLNVQVAPLPPRELTPRR